MRKLLFLNVPAPSRPAADSLLLLSRRGAPGKCKQKCPASSEAGLLAALLPGFFLASAAALG